MLRQYPRTIDAAARILDLCCIGIAFCVAVWLNPIAAFRWQPILWTNSTGQLAQHEYLLFVTVAMLSWAILSHYMGVYRSHRAEPMPMTLSLHLKTQVVWMMMCSFLVFLIKFDRLWRGFLGSFFVYAMILLTMREIIVVLILNNLRSRGYNLRRVAIIGDPVRAQNFANFVEQNSTAGLRVVEIEDDDRTVARNSDAGPDFDEAFIVAAATEKTDLESLALRLLKRSKRVHIVPGMFDGRLFRQELEDFGGIPVLSIGGQGLDPLQAAFKRVLDVIVAIVALAILSPVLALIALLVKVTSTGPVLYKQERLGKGGRHFFLYKFRTMARNAEEVLQADPVLYKKYVENNFKLPKGEDPRITGLGRLLRSTSLDELPQLFNVLVGDMSLVGPRPIVPTEIDQYGDVAELFLSVQPGLTGNWQVNGRSEVGDYGRRAAMDLEYIRDQSLSTDVAILLKTIPAVLRRKGAH
ncbi:MAG TPA: sugar transferase [Candidatus Binataceae bacterium]|nr:sugar transferase [Candidatus Binataceae bacterium]